MRIGLLASLAWPVPPPVYGSWELVVANLAEGLTARGHEVVVFASGDSHPAGELRTVVARCADDDEAVAADRARLDELHVRAAFEAAADLDVVHNHTGGVAVRLAPACPVPLVTTLHASGNVPEDRRAYLARPSLPYVSASDAERRACPDLRYVATVPHGVAVDRFPYRDRPGDYLAYLGRIAPDKGVHHAVAVARATGVRLVLAGVVHAAAASYWEDEIAPAVRAGHAEFIGPVGHEEKAELLAGALGFLHLVDCDEAFGLTIAEAMACGTPVIGTRRGSVPELVVDGVTGVLVDDPAHAVAAVDRLVDCDRGACRRRAEERYSIPIMAQSYEAVYADLLGEATVGAAGFEPALGPV